MRANLLAALAVTTGCLATSPALADDPVQAAVPADASAEKAAIAADLPAAAGAKDPEAIHLPPGFKPKKRGKFTIYCRKESAMGTRFPVEKCYNEAGIRQYIAEQREREREIDQMRRICSTQGACGGT